MRAEAVSLPTGDRSRVVDGGYEIVGGKVEERGSLAVDDFGEARDGFEDIVARGVDEVKAEEGFSGRCTEVADGWPIGKVAPTRAEAGAVVTKVGAEVWKAVTAIA